MCALYSIPEMGRYETLLSLLGLVKEALLCLRTFRCDMAPNEDQSDVPDQRKDK